MKWMDGWRRGSYNLSINEEGLDNGGEGGGIFAVVFLLLLLSCTGSFRSELRVA